MRLHKASNKKAGHLTMLRPLSELNEHFYHEKGVHFT